MQSNYYIVCPPISFNNHLNKDELDTIYNQIIDNLFKRTCIYHVYLDIEEAKFIAANLNKRDLPTFFDNQYAKTHSLAKPILSLSLPVPLVITKKSETTYYALGKVIKPKIDAYVVEVTVLQQALDSKDSNCTIVLNNKEYKLAKKTEVPNISSISKCTLI